MQDKTSSYQVIKMPRKGDVILTSSYKQKQQGKQHLWEERLFQQGLLWRAAQTLMLVLMAPLPKSSRVRGSVLTLSLFDWDSGTISCKSNGQYAVKEFCNLALHKLGSEERIQIKIVILSIHETSVTVDQRLYSLRGGGGLVEMESFNLLEVQYASPRPGNKKRNLPVELYNIR